MRTDLLGGYKVTDESKETTGIYIIKIYNRTE